MLVGSLQSLDEIKCVPVIQFYQEFRLEAGNNRRGGSQRELGLSDRGSFSLSIRQRKGE